MQPTPTYNIKQNIILFHWACPINVDPGHASGCITIIIINQWPCIDCGVEVGPDFAKAICALNAFSERTYQ